LSFVPQRIGLDVVLLLQVSNANLSEANNKIAHSSHPDSAALGFLSSTAASKSDTIATPPVPQQFGFRGPKTGARIWTQFSSILYLWTTFSGQKAASALGSQKLRNS
jgi:hypothetical protein